MNSLTQFEQSGEPRKLQEIVNCSSALSSIRLSEASLRLSLRLSTRRSRFGRPLEDAENIIGEPGSIFTPVHVSGAPCSHSWLLIDSATFDLLLDNVITIYKNFQDSTMWHRKNPLIILCDLSILRACFQLKARFKNFVAKI